MTNDSRPRDDGDRAPAAPEGVGDGQLPWASQPGSPATDAAHGARDAPPGPVRRQQPQDPHAAPHDGPDGLAAARSQGTLGRGRTADRRTGRPRPHQHADGDVEQRRARGTGERGRRAGEEHAEALAERPHAERPREGEDERRLDRLAHEEAGADEDLHGGEERVGQRGLHRDQVRHVGHRTRTRRPAGPGPSAGSPRGRSPGRTSSAAAAARPSSSQRRPSPIWIDRADTRPAPAGRMAVS